MGPADQTLLDYEPPCTDNADRWWSSDPDDIEAAAHGCQRCRVLHLCRDYADAAAEPAGVWTGRRPTHYRLTEGGAV